MEITVRGKDGKIKEKRGKRRVLQPGGGVENQEVDISTIEWVERPTTTSQVITIEEEQK